MSPAAASSAAFDAADAVRFLTDGLATVTTVAAAAWVVHIASDYNRRTVRIIAALLACVLGYFYAQQPEIFTWAFLCANFSSLVQITAVVLSTIGALGSLTLMLPGIFFGYCLGPQNLREKYGAEWAVVTGGSSGIGKEIVRRLCSQGINVVIVAVPDQLLEDTTAEFQAQYPDVEIVPVGADLSRPGFMEKVKEAVDGHDVQLLFCNAGFMISGFFADCPIGKSKANAAVNVGCHLELTHEFVNRMLAKGQRGAVFFTSSPAWMLPSPTAAMYAGTKAFISHFGVSLAAEIRSRGIDVCVVHPSPVQSRFYDNAPDGAEINFFKSTARGPEVIVRCMFAAVGHLVLCNEGYFPKVMGLLHHLMDFSLLSEITARTAHTVASFKQAAAQAAARKQKSPTPSKRAKGGKSTKKRRSASRSRRS